MASEIEPKSQLLFHMLVLLLFKNCFTISNNLLCGKTYIGVDIKTISVHFKGTDEEWSPTFLQPSIMY